MSYEDEVVRKMRRVNDVDTMTTPAVPSSPYSRISLDSAIAAAAAGVVLLQLLRLLLLCWVPTPMLDEVGQRWPSEKCPKVKAGATRNPFATENLV